MPEKIPVECISWRWNGNLGEDLIRAVREAMFSELALGQQTGAAKFVGVRGPLSRERLTSWGAPAGRVGWIGKAAG
jgi:hypothetical protein